MPRLSQTLEVDSLAPAAKAFLAPVLYPIFCESYGDLPMETVCEEILFAPDTSLFLVEDDEVSVPVGFFCLHRDVVELQGRSVKVYSIGAYFKRGVRGGVIANQRGFVRLLWDCLSHPLEESYLFVQTLTPVSYRRLLKGMSEAWPNRCGPTPPKLQDITQAILEAKGLSRSGLHPSVIRYPDPARLEDPARILSHPVLSEDLDVQHYLELNPDFTEGDVLCCIAPLTARNLFVSALMNLFPNRS